MPITIHCLCNKTFQVPDELAGKRIKCGKCGRPHRVPVASPSSSPEGGVFGLLDESEIAAPPRPTCPSCQKKLKPGAVICVDCGVNVRTGEPVGDQEETGSSDRKVGLKRPRQSAMPYRVQGAAIGLAVGVGIGLICALISSFLGGIRLGPVEVVKTFDDQKKQWVEMEVRSRASERTGQDILIAAALSAIAGGLVGGLAGRMAGGSSTQGGLGFGIGLAVGCADFMLTQGMWPSAPAPWTYLTSAVAAGIVAGAFRD